jgi:hypothetical protein
MLLKLADPVLSNLAQRRLRAAMPIETLNGLQADHPTTHLEAFARVMCGIAPWLEAQGLDGEEEQKRAHYASLAREAIDAATAPASPDVMVFDRDVQPLVEAAFLSHALLRAPRELWARLPDHARANLVVALRSSRAIPFTFNNNWRLFPAIVEAALHQCGEEWNYQRVSEGLDIFRKWYVGDGAYSDGPRFRWDYYNSFTIQPMLLDTLRVLGDQRPEWQEMREPALVFARRYAEVLERMISPEGTLPPIGRSLTYRFGALQLLAQVALMDALPVTLPPGQARSAMTAVLRRMMEAPRTFDSQGWLQIGFCGHQPSLAEGYISTGSLYLCAAGFLPLGLPPDAPFWSDPASDWTAKRIWDGQDMPADRAVRRPNEDRFPQ